VNDDVRGWRDATTILALAAVTLYFFDILGFRLTQTFLFFAIYLPLAFSTSMYLWKMFLKRRRGY